MYPIIFVIPTGAPALLRLVLLGTAAIGFVIALQRALRSRSWQRLSLELLVVGLLALTGWLTPKSLGNEGTQLRSFGVLLAIAWAGSWFVARRQAHQNGWPRLADDWSLVLMGFWGLGMARIAYIVSDPRLLHCPTEWLSVSSGGLLGWGSILGLGMALLVATRKDGSATVRHRIDLLGLSLGWFVTVTRLGCYLTGCDYGRRLSSEAPWWLVRLGTFPRWESPLLPLGSGAPSWVEQVGVGRIAFARPSALPVHPTQLYEALLGVALCILSLWLSGRRRFPGELGAVVVVGYAVVSTLIELSFADTTAALSRLTWVTHLLRGLVTLVAVSLYLRWSKAKAPSNAVNAERPAHPPQVEG